EPVNRSYGWDRQSFDAVEDCRYRVDNLLNLIFAGEVVELLDVGSGDEAFVLARHYHEAAQRLIAGALLGRAYDGFQLFKLLTAKRILRLARNVYDRPGNPLDVYMEVPMLHVRDVRSHERSLSQAPLHSAPAPLKFC